MRRVLLAVGLIVVSLVAAGCCPTLSNCCGGTLCGQPQGNPHLGRVRHVVLFKFKDGTTPEQVQAIEKAFLLLPAEVEEIRDLEWGTDMSIESLAAGYTHCFLVTFDTPDARDAYLPHPAHQDFGKQLKPILDKVLVIDYVAKD